MAGRLKEAFIPLIKKVSRILESWMFQKITQSGKLILIKSILVAMASHIIAIYLLLVFTLKKFSSLLLRIFWSSLMDKHPMYLKNCASLEKHKHEGGLGLRNLQSLNKAIILRQAWRMQSLPELLASRIFRAKYGDSWFEKAVNSRPP